MPVPESEIPPPRPRDKSVSGESSGIDILCSTWGGERFIRDFVLSLGDQTCRAFRFLVRDDGSPDGTVAALRAAAETCGLVPEFLASSGRHLGVVKSFGELLAASSAPYVLFADQDDIWHRDKVETMLRLMRLAEARFGKETPLLLHSDLRVIDAEGAPKDRSFVRRMHLSPGRCAFADLLVQNCVTGCAMMVNGALRARVRQPLPDEAVCHDWYLALLASAAGKILFTRRILTDYRDHGGNVFGARRKNIFHALLPSRGGRGFLSERLQLTRRQAGAFLRQYGDVLNPADRAAAGAWADLGELSKIRRLTVCRKFGFRKNTLLRNVGMWWAI